MAIFLDRYEILKTLGQGNMGQVYLAKRVDGVFDKKVAIKFLRSDRLSEEISKRFLSEQRILAKLEHPSIVRLIDAGFDDERQSPYIIMEYVDGQNIMEHCFSRQLSAIETIEIFIKVCDAISFAHKNFIIHRDIKPSNILVDAESGQVKVLDFGIAKVLEAQNDEETLTQFNAAGPMTPRYASPEQLSSDSLTTVSDIYSLGVLLHELLSYSTIYPKAKSNFELIKAILTDEPKAPSEVLKKMTLDTAETVLGANDDEQDKRQERDRKKRLQTLKGDLDKITLKALEKKPENRYQSVDNLKSDLTNFLAGRPVQARNQSFPYLIRKFVMRRKITSLFILFVFILVISQVFFVYRELKRTEKELAVSREIERYLVGIFSPIDAYRSTDQPILAKDLIRLKADNLSNAFEKAPVIRLSMRLTFAEILTSFNELTSAKKLYQQSLVDTTSSELSRDKSFQSRLGLARIASLEGDYKEANLVLEKIIKDIGKDQTLSDQNYLLAIAYELIGLNFRKLGDLEKSIESYVLASQHLSATTRNDEKLDFKILTGFSVYHELTGEYQKSIDFLQKGMAKLKKSESPSKLMEANLLSDIATNWHGLGNFEKAVNIFEKSIQKTQEVLGDASELEAITLSQMSKTLSKLGKKDEALAALSKAVAIDTSIFGQKHPRLAIRYNNIGDVYNSMKQPEKAIPYFEKALAIDKVTRDPLSVEIATRYFNLGESYRLLRKYEQSLTYFHKTLKIDLATLGENSIQVAGDYAKIATVEKQAENRHLALKYYKKALVIVKALTHPPKNSIKKLEGEIANLTESTD